ncbi:hypothetical protein [Methylocystis echinoides]|uniref:hypothetical protein n=1 Tax=Methylocystis echinoides TaxID=29468 RepID=UPI003449A442
MSDASPASHLSSNNISDYLVSVIPLGADWETAGQARLRFLGERYEDASHVFLLTKESRLAGIVAMRDLLAAAETTPLLAIARDADPYASVSTMIPSTPRGRPFMQACPFSRSATRNAGCSARYRRGP